MLHSILKDKKIVLASQSPRRKEIFKLLGLKALQFPAGIEEEIFTASPRILVQKHAKDKAIYVARKIDSGCVVVGADTVVYHDNIILGKPKNHFEAADYLTRLSGNSHWVYSGIAIVYKNKVATGYVKSRVEFNTLSAKEIEEYIATNEPMDKAGAYGIQGYGSQFIKKISGCYFNVMGFPISLFYDKIKEMFQNETVL